MRRCHTSSRHNIQFPSFFSKTRPAVVVRNDRSQLLPPNLVFAPVVPCPECPNERLPRQDLLTTPTWKRPRSRPRTRSSDNISDLAWPHLGVEPAELSEIAVDREVFRAVLGLLPPRPSPGEKRVWKWMNGCVAQQNKAPIPFDVVNKT